MKIRTILVDDDENSKKAAAAALKAFDQIELVGRCSGSSDLFELLEANPVDLVFLDIELKGEMGFDIARRLKEEYPDMMFVFLTGHASYAIDGYDFQPVHFLTKPINPEKLAMTVEEVIRRKQHMPKQHHAQLMFHMQQGYQIVDVGEICYIERKNRRNYMVTIHGSFQIAGDTMRDLEEMLEPYDFLLCHQSFLISLHRIRHIYDAGRQLYEAEVEGAAERIPISRGKYRELHARLRELGVREI